MYPHVDIVMVAGNHEFYNKQPMGYQYDRMNDFAYECGIYFLQNDVAKIDDVYFVGSTLWTDFNLSGNVPSSSMMANSSMNDFRLIKTDSGNFTTDQWLEENKKSVNFLDNTLFGLGENATVVVVTHHAPTGMSLPMIYKTDCLSPAYASNLSNMILEFEPKVWLHGHIHDPCEYEVGDTKVISNPFGYPDENNGYNPELLIEV